MSNNGFQQIKFGELCRVQTGFPFDSDDFVENKEKGSAIVRMSNLKEGIISFDGAVYVRSDRTAKLQRFRLQPGDFLFGMSGSLDNFAIVRSADIPCYLNQRVGKLNSHNCDSAFAKHLFRSSQIRAGIHRYACGNAQLNVSPRQIEGILVTVPVSKDEQTAIARVLDSVVTALERTGAAVARARELRRGLLQASFEFRNSHEPTKDTDAGRIPRSWDAIKGKQAFIVVTGGCSSVDAIRRVRDGELPDAWFMKVDDFNAPENRRSITRTKIGFRTADNLNFKVLPLDTIVIAKRGAAILKNRVRATAAPVALDPNLMALQTLPGMRPRFLKYQLEWRNLSRYCEDSGVPQLNNKDLYPRYFLRAPDDQQEQIIETLVAADAYEDALIGKLNALETLKQSVMHDLLMGRVRVKDSKTLLKT
jgi:type I restriction enzyme S subunit